MNKNVMLFCLCLVIAIFGYKTSIGAKEQTRAVRKVSQTLTREKNKADVLLADWTYLNRSERLEKLAERHLDLTTVKPKQIVRFSNSGSINLANRGFSYKVAATTAKKKPRKS